MEFINLFINFLYKFLVKEKFMAIKFTKAVRVILGVAIVAFLVPWLTIWSINTLAVAGGITNFRIPFNF